MQKLQVGASVVYRCAVSISPNQSTYHAAIVTGLNSDQSLANLYVFPDGCDPFPAMLVPNEQRTITDWQFWERIEDEEV